METCQHLGFVLLQMDEARRHIEDGRIAQLRLALLLLDNAAEIQMDRHVRYELAHEHMKRHLREHVLEMPEGARSEELRELVEWQPLSEKRERELEFFDKKVWFLTSRSEVLGAPVGEALRRLHAYRNEAYHQARVRGETVETAAKILLDINCDLLLSLSRQQGFAFASDEDYSWLEERYRRSAMDILLPDQSFVRAAIEDIRARLHLSDSNVANTLGTHIESRIQDVFNALDEIVENTEIADREEALKHSQYAGSIRRSQIDPNVTPFCSYIPQRSCNFLEALHRRAPTIKKARGKLTAFRQFSILERELEAIERDVQELAFGVDRAMQAETDRRRGK